MIRTRLGSSSVFVTGLGLGSAPLGDLQTADADRTALATVDAAWAAGIRYFDTSPHYGLGVGERRLGAALRSRPRGDYAISSKVGRLIVDGPDGPERRWDFSADGVGRSIEESLTRLRLDRLDLVLIHDPQEHLAVALDSAYPALHRLRETGVVGAIGVGSGDVEALMAFSRECELDAVMVAGRLTLLEQPALPDLVPLCVSRGISILNVGIFNSGLLAEEWPPDSATYEYAPAAPAVLAQARRLATDARVHGSTLPRAAMEFAAAQPGVASVVVGAIGARQVERNAELFGALS